MCSEENSEYSAIAYATPGTSSGPMPRTCIAVRPRVRVRCSARIAPRPAIVASTLAAAATASERSIGVTQSEEPKKAEYCRKPQSAGGNLMKSVAENDNTVTITVGASM